MIDMGENEMETENGIKENEVVADYLVRRLREEGFDMSDFAFTEDCPGNYTSEHKSKDRKMIVGVNAPLELNTIEDLIKANGWFDIYTPDLEVETTHDNKGNLKIVSFEFSRRIENRNKVYRVLEAMDAHVRIHKVEIKLPSLGETIQYTQNQSLPVADYFQGITKYLKNFDSAEINPLEFLVYARDD